MDYKYDSKYRSKSYNRVVSEGEVEVGVLEDEPHSVISESNEIGG
jgi:hypothetical protein